MKGHRPTVRPEGWIPPDGAEAKRLYRDGHFSLVPPPVWPAGWTNRDWRNYISNGGGRWLPGGPLRAREGGQA